MTVNWKSGVNGDWSAATDWSSASVPGATDAVSIAAAGSYTVTVDFTEAAQSIALNSAHATLAVNGAGGTTLTVGNTLSVSAGTLALIATDNTGTGASAGALAGGTLTIGSGGTLSVQAVVTATNQPFFEINTVANLSGSTTLASGANISLSAGGNLAGTITGAGGIKLFGSTFKVNAPSVAGIGYLDLEGATANFTAASGTVGGDTTFWDTSRINIAAASTITFAGALSAGFSNIANSFLSDSSYDNVISGPGTLSTVVAYVNTAGATTDELLVGNGLTWNNSGAITDYGQIAMNLVGGGDSFKLVNNGILALSGNDAGIIDNYTDGTDTLINNGTLSKIGNMNSDGTATTPIDAIVNSTGIIDVDVGTLALTHGGALSGTLSGAGTLLLLSGSYTVNGLSGSGHLSVGTGASVTYVGNVGAPVTLDGNETIAIPAGTTQTFSGPFTIGDASGGGTITGPGTLVTSGATSITDLAGAQALGLNGTLAWTNSGTVSEFGLVASSGAILTNTGTYDFASDSATFTGSGSTDIFRNTGTLGKTAGIGSSFLSDVIASTGTINVATGALVLGAGGSVSGVLSGAGALHLSNGTFITAGLSGNGTLAIDNLPGTGYGTLTVSASSTISTAVRLDGNATIEGTAGKILTFSGPLAINTVESSPSPDGGNLTGPGTLTTTGATTIGTVTNGNNYAAVTLSSGITWINSATGTVTDAGSGTSDGGTIANAGVFNFASDAASMIANSASDSFRNTGTFGKTGGAGSSLVTDVVTSTGTINVATGALVFGGGGSVSGVLTGASALHLSNGNFTTTGISGSGTLVIDNLVGTGYGTLTASATSTITASVRIDGNATLGVAAGKTLTLTGPLAINTVESSPSPDGGTLTGSGTITTTGVTTIGTVTNGNNLPAVALGGGVTWINSATGTVTDSGSGTSSNATIVNAGVFNFATDTGGFAAGSAQDVFRNTGTLGKTGGIGTSLVTDVVTSTGTINVATGALVLGGGGAVSGTLNGSGALHLSNGNFTTAGIAGSGNLVIDNLVGTGYGTLTASATSTITASVRIDGNATLGVAAGKTLTLTGPLAINTVESSPSPDGGTLTGPGTITTTGVTTIGTVTNGNNLPAVALGGGVTWINSATGTVTDSGSGTSSNATIVNAGVFNFATDAGGIAAASASDVLINTGTLGKTGGTGTSLVTDVVTSTGTINVAAGALVLGGGGAVSGTLNGSGALHLSNGNFTTAGIAGSGNLVIDNLVGTGYGTLTASTNATLATSVRLDGNATIGAATGATLTLLNQFSVNTVESSPSPDGGTLTGPGTIVTDNLVTIGTVTNGNNTPALTLGGGITWANPSTVHDSGLIASSTATIANSGAFDFTADTGAITAASGADVFLNTGTLAKTGGTGTSTIADSVTNNFLIDAASGTLAITNAILGTGALHIDAGATLDIATIFASQSVTFTGGAGATLRLETPASASFTGFAAGDRLDLAGNPVSAATISGTTLTVTTAAGSFTYVSAGLAGDVAAISADATNGSFISIYRAATAAHTPEPLAFGNHHVGDITTNKLALTVSNTDVADGYSEKLNANLSGATAGFTAAGAVSGIAAGASNSTSLTVTLDTSTAGAKAGTAKLALATNGSGVDGRGSTPLAGQTVNLTGAVYAYAAAHLASTSVTLGNQHVGAAAHGVLSLSNSAAAGGFSEGLDAKFIGGAGGATGTGTATLIAAGATDSTSLLLGLSASAAGTASGSETLILISDGAGTSGLGTTALGTQTVTVSGAFYNLAVGHLASATLNLGIIHANTAATGALSVGNSAAAGSYSESLDAGLSGASAGLSTAGTITGLLAGATNATALQLSVTTAATGAYSGTATLGLVSDGAGTSGLGTTSLGSQTVTVTATVDNYALAAFADAGGPAITGTSTNATINLGSAIQGGAGLILHLGAENAATGTADLLTGTISSAGAAGFTNAGFGSIGAALSAGQIETAQTVTLSTTIAGVFTETVLLSTAGTNASGYNGALATETLTITGTITPSVFTTYTLALGPNTITGADGKGDIFIATAGALNSRDRLTGGNGANSITLSGAGLFDVNAPALLSNIPTINAHEGQAASGTHANTTQTVLLRDGVTQTLNVAAGTPVAGNANAETIAIYGGTGTETIKLAAGADQVFLSTGTDTITLGSAANSITAGGGSATIRATAGFAGASIVGATSGSTTLAVSTSGAVNLNAADTHLTVQLSGASQLKLGALSFITAIGSAGADTLTAGGAGQTLTGGLGADSLMGSVGGGDLFADTAAGLNGDTIGNWMTGDQIDVRDIAGATASYSAGTLTLAGGGHSAAIKITGSFAQTNFMVIGSDGAGGTLIGFHS